MMRGVISLLISGGNPDDAAAVANRVWEELKCHSMPLTSTTIVVTTTTITQLLMMSAANSSSVAAARKKYLRKN